LILLIALFTWIVVAGTVYQMPRETNYYMVKNIDLNNGSKISIIKGKKDNETINITEKFFELLPEKTIIRVIDISPNSGGIVWFPAISIPPRKYEAIRPDSDEYDDVIKIMERN